MMINNLNFYPYKLNFSSVLKTSKEDFNIREGLLLRLTSDTNKFYWGDVTPLPSFGTETFTEAKEEVKTLIPVFENTDLPEIFNLVNSFRLFQFPALKFGIEQAIINFSFDSNFKPVTEQFVHTNLEIATSALLGSNSIKNGFDEFSELLKKGIKTFKIKIGRNNFNKDLEYIKNIRELGSNFKIRLDANASWSLREAKKFIPMLRKYDIEFIEQPVKTLKDLYELAKFSEVPIAVDESVTDYKTAVKIIESGKFNFIVLKPVVLGSIFDSLKLINLANSKKINAIVSSSFESMLGKSILFLLAAQANHNFAHGLIANKIFDKDLFSNPFDSVNGKIKFELNKYIEFIEKLSTFDYDNR